MSKLHFAALYLASCVHLQTRVAICELQGSSGSDEHQSQTLDLELKFADRTFSEFSQLASSLLAGARADMC